MTSIQRQYSLPNCTLFLEGFSDRPKTGFTGVTTESRPLISILLTAECRLGGDQVLRGGREFLISLVRATSLYAQEVLSGVNASKLLSGEMVKLQRLGLNQHQLLVDNPEAETQHQEVTLSSSQLFDLIEAVDQFLADPQTLPDVSLELSPISKRYIQVKHPIAEQVVPASVGVASLAVAAIAMSMIPAPTVLQSPDKLPDSVKTQINGTPTPTPSPSPMLITDETQLEEIKSQLFTVLDKNWKVGTPSEPVVYRVTVDSNSRVLGYLPQGDLAREELNKTPLLDLLRLSKEGGSLYAEKIAQYEVTFNPNGTLDVRLWKNPTTQGALLNTPPPTSAPESPGFPQQP